MFPLLLGRVCDRLSTSHADNSIGTFAARVHFKGMIFALECARLGSRG